MAAPRISSSSSPSPMLLLVSPSMAMGIGSLPLRVGYLTSSTSKLVMMCCSNNHVSNIQTCRSSSPNNIKIFEDRSAGIVCYRDENGEITCEGYDEGPRFHHKFSTFHFNTPAPTRDVEIIHLLQRCWLQVAEDEGGN